LKNGLISWGTIQFNYPKYFQEYSQWTVSEFREEMPNEFQKMKDWIDLRITEFTNGERIAENKNVLPDVSDEQKDRKKHGVWDMLINQKVLVIREVSIYVLFITLFIAKIKTNIDPKMESCYD